MDYKKLLRKYMAFVLACEGTTFVHRAEGEIVFTSEELKVLENIDASIEVEQEETAAGRHDADHE